MFRVKQVHFVVSKSYNSYTFRVNFSVKVCFIGKVYSRIVVIHIGFRSAEP